jgi:hypothetical protein
VETHAALGMGATRWPARKLWASHAQHDYLLDAPFGRDGAFLLTSVWCQILVYAPATWQEEIYAQHYSKDLGTQCVSLHCLDVNGGPFSIDLTTIGIR